MCGVFLLSHFIMSNTFDMTYFVRADNLISLLLVSSDIFHYLCSLFLCLTSAVFTTALCSPENRRQVLLCKYTQSLTVFRTGGCGKTDNRVVNFIKKSFFFFFFFKPVQRTDKEYLLPRSSGLLQLCTLTGATSRLSKP